MSPGACFLSFLFVDQLFDRVRVIFCGGRHRYDSFTNYFDLKGMKIRVSIKHILFWAFLYLFWVLVFQQAELAFSQTATVEFCYLLFIAANYYFNTLYFIPRLLHQKKYWLFSLCFTGSIGVTALLRVPLAMFLNRTIFLPGKPQPGFAAIFTHSLLNISFWVIVIVAARLVIDRFRFQQYVDAVKQQKEEAELAFLNAQFNPHFLFNSINSIYGHIEKQNTTARNMLLSFSEMLRYQLYECNEQQILVDREVQYVRNYVALQKVRKNAGLRVNLEVGENVKSFQISPLLFIAFIENSFKYVGSGDEPGDFVCISFRLVDGELVFVNENSKGTSPSDSSGHKGIGMNNARRRLELLYPGRHELSIRDNEQTYRVELKIKIA